MKCLFITSTRIGDAVLSTGLLNELIRSDSLAKITVACGPAAAPLFEEMPNLESVLIMEKRVASLHWFDLWKKCLGTKWDLIIDLRNSPISRMLYAKSRFFLERKDGSKHRVQQLGTVMGFCPPPSPKLWISGDHEERARILIPEPNRVLALGPMANWKGKEWQPERFSQLACRLTKFGGVFAGAPILILGGESEQVKAERVAADIPRSKCINLVGKLDLLTVYAVLRRSAFFIGNDSGLMHIAAASGIPTLGLFGPSQEQQYGPWGENASWVRTSKTYDELVGQPGYDHRKTESLMSSLSIGDVESAVVDLWGSISGLENNG